MKKATFKIADKEITLETGEIAKQAHGSVLVSHKDTVVLVTVVAEEEATRKEDFFPLSVEYRERTAAAGRIPGGFIKRESRPQDHEILASRLIDRSVRPLFPEWFTNETQIMATVLSYEPDAEAEPLCIIGASAALHLSNIPWNGPVGGLRLIRKNDKLIALPAEKEREDAEMDMVISCSKEGLVMLEGEARETSEEKFLEAIDFAHASLVPFFQILNEWQKELNIVKRDCPKPAVNEELQKTLEEIATPVFRTAMVGKNKQERARQMKEAQKKILAELQEKFPDNTEEIPALLEDLKYHLFRTYMVQEKKRVDGRTFEEVRPISGKVSWLPRNHGSVVFTRGETQAIVSCTLGAPADVQIVDTLSGEIRQRFMLHYNFPPYSVGEIKALRGPGRREIGHGFLATRALQNVLPEHDKFPYTIRIISDITESNGSSSMASVCGGCLSLMDAGVPIIRPVAGVAMGLIKEGEEAIVLTDIMGEEDHLGDMDFKVAGTEMGITAVQMDNKLGSLPRSLMNQALEQAKQGRLHILKEMKKILPETRKELPACAPRVKCFIIRKDRIRDLIGPGGKNIQEVQEACKVKIDVDSSTGLVSVFSANQESLDRAISKVDYLTGEAEVGKCYKGEVISIKPFGAFVRILNNTEGLLHISELDNKRVDKVTDIIKEGEQVLVKVLGVDRQGKISLSRREALYEKKK